MTPTVKKAVIGFVTMAVSYGFVMVLMRDPADHDQFGMRITLGAVLALFYVAFFIPPVTDFIERHARAVKWTGIAIVIAGFGLLIGSAVISAGEPPTDACVGSAMIGFMLAFIPGQLPVLRRAQAAACQKKKETTSAFDAVSAGWEANAFVLGSLLPFLRLCGSWVMLIWAGTGASVYAVIAIKAGGWVAFDQIAGKIDTEVLLVGLLLPFQTLLALGVATSLVAWHRFAAGLPSRGAPLPGKAAWRYLWRLWMISAGFAAVSQLALKNAPGLSDVVGTSHVAVVAGVLYAAFLLLMILTASSFALVLPAIALGRKDFAGSDSMRLVPRFRFAFAFGFVIAMLPFLALAGGCGWLVLTAMTTSGIFTAAFGSIFFLMMGLASGASYLSRAYDVLTTPANGSAP